MQSKGTKQTKLHQQPVSWGPVYYSVKAKNQNIHQHFKVSTEMVSWSSKIITRSNGWLKLYLEEPALACQYGSLQNPALGLADPAATTPIPLPCAPVCPLSIPSAGVSHLPSLSISCTSSLIFRNWYGHLELYRNWRRSNLLSSGEQLCKSGSAGLEQQAGRCYEMQQIGTSA